MDYCYVAAHFILLVWILFNKLLVFLAFRVMNYCRIFTEYGESMIPYMLRSWRDPHYSINIINLILTCEGHHDYDVREITAIWYLQGVMQI